MKILTQITIKDDNELAEIWEVFPKRINERTLWQWQQTYLENLFCLLQCFFCYKDQRRKDGNDFETHTFTASGFKNPPELNRAKTYSALSFDRIKFFNMETRASCLWKIWARLVGKSSRDIKHAGLVWRARKRRKSCSRRSREQIIVASWVLSKLSA